jgi:ferredoxin, 2Fe-2S
MAKLTVTTRGGERRTVEARAGQSVKEALMDGGISEINAITSCGGCCSCGTCHVFVDPADMQRLPPMHEQENDLLYVHSNRRATSRLSCQIKVTEELDGLSVTVAPEYE